MKYPGILCSISSNICSNIPEYYTNCPLQKLYYTRVLTYEFFLYLIKYPDFFMWGILKKGVS